MKPSKAILRVLLLLTLLCASVSLWVLRKQERSIKPEILVDGVTAKKTWFPNLRSRSRFGAPDVWRDPSVDSKNTSSTDVIDDIAERTFYMLKTGADVMWDRLPIHLETTLKRFPYHQIYADTSAIVGDETVVDVIEMLPDSIILEYLHGYKLRRESSEESWGWANTQIVHDSSDGWTTDKFKNIPMMLHAFRTAPKHCDWFVFADDDTYLLSQSLGSILRDLDPQDHYYLGSAAMLADQMTEMGDIGQKLKADNEGGKVLLHFAHGGSGVIVSRGAVEALFWDAQREDDMVKKYSEDTVYTCCGDAAFAYMLREELELTVNQHIDSSLMVNDPLQGETLGTTRYFVSTGGLCSRLLSWHHIQPWEIQKLFDWEQSLVYRKSNTDAGILYSDAYHDFVLPYIATQRDNWDNGATTERYDWTRFLEVEGSDTNEMEVIYPSDSQNDCLRACEIDPRCLGWKYDILVPNGTCSLEYHDLLAGLPVDSVDEFGNTTVSVVSGWLLERIRTLRSGESCDNLEYDLSTEMYNDSDDEREGWYFRNLQTERESLPRIYNL